MGESVPGKQPADVQPTEENWETSEEVGTGAEPSEVGGSSDVRSDKPAKDPAKGGDPKSKFHG
jgi:hypothetical protein